MQTRRSLLTAAGTALAATSAGCSLSNVTGGGGDGGDRSSARRWQTTEVATAPYDLDGRSSAGEEPPRFRSLAVTRPSHARGVEAFSDGAIDRLTSHGDVGDVSLPMDDVDEIAVMLGNRVDAAIGTFDPSDPPAAATEIGSHRGATLYARDYPDSARPLDGYAIDAGRYVRVREQSTVDAARTALRALLDAEAGAGASYDDADVDRVWSFVEQGVFESYYSQASGRGGISLRADGDVVHRRSIMLEPNEDDAIALYDQIQEWRSTPLADGASRPYNDFGPYDDVTVNRDGRAVTVEGSLPASAVGAPEFQTP